MTKLKEWIVFTKESKIYAIEDDHKNKMIDGAILGYVLAKNKQDVIDYIAEIIGRR